MPGSGLRGDPLQILARLRSPEAVQRFLDDEVQYNNGPTTFRSPRRVACDRTAHCLEGALFAAAALERLGHPPLIVDLAAVRDEDHVIAVFRENDCWGAIAKSNYAGLRHRTPVYRTLRELALSYFEHYFNARGEKTLRAYSRPVLLKRFDHLDWRAAAEDLWEIPLYLVGVPHLPLLPAAVNAKRFQMDKRLYEAGRVGAIP